MKKTWMAGPCVFFLALCTNFAYAHHPAVDMVDAEIYIMISENVADTPHAELVFDETMGDGNDVSTIYIPTVTDAERMLRDGLLTNLSLLDGEVTLSIEFYPDSNEIFENTISESQGKFWSDWGRPIKITINHIYDVK